MKSTPPLSLHERDFLIVGLGLMGGSLALALKGKCRNLWGVERDGDASRFALEQQIVQEVFPSLSDAPSADVVILAVPVENILSVLEDFLQPTKPMVVMDIGSTKSKICRAMEKLPPNIDPIGGHPMCGKEVSGITAAEANLYHGAPFALIPLQRTGEYAKSIALDIVDALGARPIWLDAETHDRIVAAVSHVPYLVASALASATPLNTAPMVGPGFRSSTRLALTPTAMMSSVLKTNRKYILESLSAVQQELNQLRALLEECADSELEDKLNATAEYLKKILNNR